MFKNEKAFTLVEMLIVLMIISVLLILIVPNLINKGKDVYEQGCDALVAVVQAQADAYTIEKGSPPTSIGDLVPEYIREDQKTCPQGDVITIDQKGNVGRVPEGS
ncbi:competence type IV pilus major pilin ComGC [Lentibacillus saliphilus]|uniref:competence type IV pilus major pilin ComGC n=1 Tax=Lentibacillus saliphilus TaxID=2737028 RepID=UPI001C2FF0A7|nr:competence type IV pilus major pilin ComGC [Lentibacillus saliphilus]